MTIRYTVTHSQKARYMRLTVRPGGDVILTVPSGAGETAITRFMDRHMSWVVRAVKRMRNQIPLPVYGKRAYVRYKEEARSFVEGRVHFWASIYKISFKRIAIRNTKTRWGSCSREGNLNFSYAILFLPKELADYCIVHEICHLKEHNHSKNFWALVEAALPDYKKRRVMLRKYAL